MLKERAKKLFIPHEGNKYRPDILERVSIGVMLFLILLSFTLANLQSILWIGSDFLVSSILPAVIIDLTNEERTHETLGTLKRSPLLDEAANLKAQDMAKYSYFAHYSPTGVSPWFWFDKVSYNFLHAGENLAVYFTDSGDVVKAWMNSPAHRDNILNENFTEIGVGTAKGEYKGFPTVFVVQLFGTPQSLASTKPTALTLEVTSNTSAEKQPAPAQEVAQASITTIPETRLKQSTSAPISLDTASATKEYVTVDDVSQGVVVLSDLATTSRLEVPPTVTNMTDTDSAQSWVNMSLLERLAVQPSLWLQAVYAVLALFVIVSLILAIVIEWRKQHPVQIAYAGGLLAVMVILFYVHVALTSGVIIV